MNHRSNVWDAPREWARRPTVMCNGCGANPLPGTRWKCTACQNFNLCDACYQFPAAAGGPTVTPGSKVQAHAQGMGGGFHAFAAFRAS